MVAAHLPPPMDALVAALREPPIAYEQVLLPAGSGRIDAILDRGAETMAGHERHARATGASIRRQLRDILDDPKTQSEAAREDLESLLAIASKSLTDVDTTRETLQASVQSFIHAASSKGPRVRARRMAFGLLAALEDYQNAVVDVHDRVSLRLAEIDPASKEIVATSRSPEETRRFFASLSHA